MRVILHIGTNKTGTSSLQKWFRSNRDQLLKQGILWPQLGLAQDAHYGLSRMLGFSDQGPALEGAELEAARDQLLEEVESSGASVVLLSSEQLVLNKKLKKAPVSRKGLDGAERESDLDQIRRRRYRQELGWILW